jgi:tetratricopeptide (TPR) repeat protein
MNPSERDRVWVKVAELVSQALNELEQQEKPPQPVPAKTAGQWMEEGERHKITGHYEQALITFEQTIALDPDNASAYFYKGFVLHKLQRYKEAQAAFERSIQLATNNALAYDALTYYNEGNMFIKLQRSS